MKTSLIKTEIQYFKKILDEEIISFFTKNKQHQLLGSLHNLTSFSPVYKNIEDFIDYFYKKYYNKFFLYSSSIQLEIIINFIVYILELLKYGYFLNRHIIRPKIRKWGIKMQPYILNFKYNLSRKYPQKNLFWILIGTAVLTSLYIFRLFYRYKKASKVIQVTFLEVLKKAALKIGINVVTSFILSCVIYFIVMIYKLTRPSSVFTSSSPSTATSPTTLPVYRIAYG